MKPNASYEQCNPATNPKPFKSGSSPISPLDEGCNLEKYGLHAKVLHLPGHSKGSIGFFTDNGYLFCGDMFYNVPRFRFIDDKKDHQASVAKLRAVSQST